ncbi:Tll0287-like domain-containing protein [Hyella patelloides]|nr:DUF3365 domain-containing protein [Hyella patelloides]
MSSLSQAKDWFLQLLYKRIIHKQIIIILLVLFLIGISITVASISRLSYSLIESQAVHSASINAQILKEASYLYTTEVVDRLQKLPGVTVTDDYSNSLAAIPPPVTYSILLSHNVTEKNISAISMRFSGLSPFRWRVTEEIKRDNFETEALEYLQNNPQKTFYRIEELNGRSTLRYVEPYIMKASCVSCDNSHPDSSKSNWQVGQIQGILEINQPLDRNMLLVRNSLTQIFIKLGVVAILPILSLTLVIGRLKFINQELKILVKKRTTELTTAHTKLINVQKDITQLQIQVNREKHQKEVNEIVNSDHFDWIAQQGKKWRQENQD